MQMEMVASVSSSAHQVAHTTVKLTALAAAASHHKKEKEREKVWKRERSVNQLLCMSACRLSNHRLAVLVTAAIKETGPTE